MIITNKSCRRCSRHDDCSPHVVVIIVADEDGNDGVVWFGSRHSMLPTCFQEAKQPERLVFMSYLLCCWFGIVLSLLLLFFLVLVITLWWMKDGRRISEL